jgi:hypothetical protein
MEQKPEATTLSHLQLVETTYIQNILKGIDDFIQYRGAQMPVKILLEWEDTLHTANDAIAKFADEQTKEELLLNHEYLRDAGRDIDEILSFLAGIFDEYRKLEIIREVIKEINKSKQ